MAEEKEKKYYYHPNIFRLENLLFSISYMVIILCWLFILLMVDDYGYDRFRFVRFSIIFSLVIVLVLNLVHIIVVTLKKTVFMVSERGVVKVSPGKIRVLQFHDINAFRYRRVLPGKGCATIETDKERIKLPFGIENLAGLVGRIRARLASAGRDTVLRDNEINELIFRAQVVELTRDSTFFLLRQLLYTLVWGIVVSSLVSAFVWQLPIHFVLIWIFFGMMLVGLNDQISRYLYMRGVLKQLIRNPSKSPRCDVTKIYLATSMVVVVLYLVGGILYKNFLGSYLY